MQRVLVCLHGWGGSKESFNELIAASNNASVIFLVPDLPGFGSEPEPSKPWTNDDYADWVQNWIATQLKEVPASTGQIEIIGHSHGGRIAMKLVHRQVTGTVLPFTITHVYLIAAAGIFHPRHVKRIIGLTLAKTGRFFTSIPGMHVLAPLAKKLLYRLVRVHDYERASTLMKTTMQLVVREDFRPIIPFITIPVDLFWGKNDGMTPYSDALYMQKHMPHAVLHTFNDGRHGIHRTHSKNIIAIILNNGQ